MGWRGGVGTGAHRVTRFPKAFPEAEQQAIAREKRFSLELPADFRELQSAACWWAFGDVPGVAPSASVRQ